MNRLSELYGKLDSSPELQNRVAIGFVLLGLWVFGLSVIVSLVQSIAQNPWLDATQVAILNHIWNGGLFYPPAAGMLEPTTPYPPGPLAIQTTLSFISPFANEVLPRIVGILSTLVFVTALVAYSIRMGRRRTAARFRVGFRRVLKWFL